MQAAQSIVTGNKGNLFTMAALLLLLAQNSDQTALLLQVDACSNREVHLTETHLEAVLAEMSDWKEDRSCVRRNRLRRASKGMLNEQHKYVVQRKHKWNLGKMLKQKNCKERQ